MDIPLNATRHAVTVSESSVLSPPSSGSAQSSALSPRVPLSPQSSYCLCPSRSSRPSRPSRRYGQSPVSPDGGTALIPSRRHAVTVLPVTPSRLLSRHVVTPVPSSRRPVVTPVTSVTPSRPSRSSRRHVRYAVTPSRRPVVTPVTPSRPLSRHAVTTVTSVTTVTALIPSRHHPKIPLV